MRYRALSPLGDSTFGSGSTAFLVNSPAAVAQAVQTRLGLATGEWFLDVTTGTPYSTEIVSETVRNTTATYDSAIQQRVLETEGVTEIVSYSSNLNRATRALTVNMTLNTIFGGTGSFGVTLTPVSQLPIPAMTNTGEIVTTNTGQEVLV